MNPTIDLNDRIFLQANLLKLKAEKNLEIKINYLKMIEQKGKQQAEAGFQINFLLTNLLKSEPATE